MMNRRPRFWFLIWVLPAIALYWVSFYTLFHNNGVRHGSYTQMRPTALNISCDLYLKGKLARTSQDQNVSHFETFNMMGMPSLASFASAPLFCDENTTTGYPVVGPTCTFRPACYVLYSFPKDQAITRIGFDWTSITSANGLKCCYYHSENGVDWKAATLTAETATGPTGNIIYNVKSTAKYHLIVMTYQGSPITLTVTESRLHGEDSTFETPNSAQTSIPPLTTITGSDSPVMVRVITPTLASNTTPNDLRRLGIMSS